MKKLLVLLLAALMLITASCAPSQPSESGDKPNPESADFSGGTEMSGTNIKAVTFEKGEGEEEQVTVSIQFVQGDERSNIAETAVNAVPAYTAYMTESPARFVVRFSSIDYWSYDRQLSIPKDDTNFHAVFKQFQLNDDSFRLVFQLKRNAKVAVTTSGDTMKLVFSEFEENTQKKWHVMCDTTQAFDQGELEGIHLLPSLCGSLSSTVLISQPFATENEAVAFQNELYSTLPSVFNVGNCFVVDLQGNALPPDTDTEEYAAFKQDIVQIDGQSVPVPPLASDAMYLCSTDDGSQLLFYKQLKDTAGTASAQLWITDSTDELRLLNRITFASVKMARFSPDGKKIAILEIASDTSYLYIYDIETNSLSNISQQGLGSYTSNFIWDPLGTALYAITGTESQRLVKYDFTIPDETARISQVDEHDVVDGDLGFLNGDIYFVSEEEFKDTGGNADYNSIIYKIKPEGGLRTKFTGGESFALSPDGGSMALLSSVVNDVESNELSSSSVLTLKDMTTLEEKVLLEGVYIVNYKWSLDGRLYYTVAIDQTLNSHYSFELRYYLPQLNQHATVAQTASSDFFVSAKPGVIYIPYVLEEEELSVLATYALDVG